jgi:hypothetical protein
MQILCCRGFYSVINLVGGLFHTVHNHVGVMAMES